MSSADRWNRIEVLFGSLFEMNAEDQRRTLQTVEDADLRAEVEALLTTHQELTARDGFLNELDTARAAARASSTGRGTLERRTLPDRAPARPWWNGDRVPGP
jgi:hypothetical protein